MRTQKWAENFPKAANTFFPPLPKSETVIYSQILRCHFGPLVLTDTGHLDPSERVAGGDGLGAVAAAARDASRCSARGSPVRVLSSAPQALRRLQADLHEAVDAGEAHPAHARDQGP